MRVGARWRAVIWMALPLPLIGMVSRATCRISTVAAIRRLSADGFSLGKREACCRFSGLCYTGQMPVILQRGDEVRPLVGRFFCMPVPSCDSQEMRCHPIPLIPPAKLPLPPLQRRASGFSAVFWSPPSSRLSPSISSCRRCTSGWVPCLPCSPPAISRLPVISWRSTAQPLLWCRSCSWCSSRSSRRCLPSSSPSPTPIFLAGGRARSCRGQAPWPAPRCASGLPASWAARPWRSLPVRTASARWRSSSSATAPRAFLSRACCRSYRLTG